MSEALEAGRVYLDDDGDRWLVTAEPTPLGLGGFFWCPDREAFISTAAYMSGYSGQSYGPFTLAPDQPAPRTLEDHAAAINQAIAAAADDGYFLDDGDSNPARLDLNAYEERPVYVGATEWIEITVPARR